MTPTLVLLFHRNIAESKTNAALRDAAQGIPDVDVVDMQARYPDGVIDMYTDAAADAQMLLAADRIVLQFPIQWYSTPALLKAWQDAVLTRMFYIFAEDEGDRMKGKPVMVAATAGNVPDAYRRGGANHFTIEELLIPLKATAHRCGLVWHPAHMVYRADNLQSADLTAAKDSYVHGLEAFIAATPVHSRRAA